MDAEAVSEFSVVPFSCHKKEHILTSKYKLNCRLTPNKTSVPQGQTHGKTPVVNVLSTTTAEVPTSLQPLKYHPILTLVRAFLFNKFLRKIQGQAHHLHLLEGQPQQSLYKQNDQ